MISQAWFAKRLTIICNNCNEVMSYGGAWPKWSCDEVPREDTVYSQYWCKTESCKVEFAGTKTKDGNPWKGHRRVKVLESDLYVGPPSDPKYVWEIFERQPGGVAA